jgi:(2Fe-2S) ferredoxin
VKARVTVCRDCCCGTAKHPDTDHDGQLRQLEKAGVRVRIAQCLDVCEHSNVMVVHPRPSGRRDGGRPVWLGGILDEATVEYVASWAAAGGPGSADLPVALIPYVIEAPGQT